MLLVHFLDGQVLDIPDPRVGHNDIQPPEPRDRLVDQFLVVQVAPDIGLKRFDPRSVFLGFLLDLKRGVFGFVVTKDYVRAGLRKKFDGRRTNPAIRCAGISLNSSRLSVSDANKMFAEESARLGLPVADPMRAGAAFERLVDGCLNN